MDSTRLSERILSMLFARIMTGYIQSFAPVLITVTPDSLTIGSKPPHASIGPGIGTGKTTSCSSAHSSCHCRKEMKLSNASCRTVCLGMSCRELSFTTAPVGGAGGSTTVRADDVRASHGRGRCWIRTNLAGFWLGAILRKLPLTRQITAQRYSLLPASFQRVTACRRPGS